MFGVDGFAGSFSVRESCVDFVRESCFPIVFWWEERLKNEREREEGYGRKFGFCFSENGGCVLWLGKRVNLGFWNNCKGIIGRIWEKVSNSIYLHCVFVLGLDLLESNAKTWVFTQKNIRIWFSNQSKRQGWIVCIYKIKKLNESNEGGEARHGG